MKMKKKNGNEEEIITDDIKVISFSSFKQGFDAHINNSCIDFWTQKENDGFWP